MSDTGHEGRAWHFYVQDMIDFAEKAVAYTKGKTRAEFVACAFNYDAHAAVWATLRSDTSRPFVKPQSGRIAVKVINRLGDEVMKVFRV